MSAANRRDDVAPRVTPGSLWRDHTGHARVQFVGNVTREGAWAVLQRCSGTARKRHRPFLYSIPAMLRGDDGWRQVDEASELRPPQVAP